MSLTASHWKRNFKFFGTRRTHVSCRPQISRLVDIMDQQLLILRRIDQRQAAADLARQPIPEVPATSSSAWNALLGSTLTDKIEPRVERWRSGLDALLVFLGLFSAIVTAFLVNSISGLTQDTAAITNEILLNLTAVVVSLGGGTSVSELNSSYNGPFQPDASNVRINSFWSISLTFSLSIAALAVGCRGFLNMATWSRHKKASERLADVWTRWTATDRLLRPVIESLPWLLILPVFLFIIGILDLLFSRLQCPGTSHPPSVPSLCLWALRIVHHRGCNTPVLHAYRREYPPCQFALSVQVCAQNPYITHPDAKSLDLFHAPSAIP
ncbi:hypothetical protein B0H11DRAFT_1249175 [Mycena galericulata]|nr:hypothetical protein B0H11DRAFT_1249175 [Mycena galericulata]